MNNTQKSAFLHYAKAARIISLKHYPIPKKTDLIAKRLFDLVFSLLVVIFLLSWLLPILALLIKITSKGPVFFIQKRTGANGQPFNCIKLRSMVVNKQANFVQAKSDDPRITKIGKFLRLTCMDELPQFINVLIGNMSIVGPRPHMISDCEKFSNVVQNYHARYQVKPGITGIAQVKGYRGATNDYFDIFHRYKWDMFYVRNLSIKLDIQILKLTISNTFLNIISRYLHKLSKEYTTSYHFNRIKSKEYLN